MKVICLTTGGLTDVFKQKYDTRLEKIYCEKSAETVVPDVTTKSGKG